MIFIKDYSSFSLCMCIYVIIHIFAFKYMCVYSKLSSRDFCKHAIINITPRGLYKTLKGGLRCLIFSITNSTYDFDV